MNFQNIKADKSQIPSLTTHEFVFIRKSAGISQRDFARSSGFHHNTINRAEKNRRNIVMPAKYVEQLMDMTSEKMWQFCMEQLKKEKPSEKNDDFQELNNIYLPKFGLTLENQQEYDRFIKYLRKYRKARPYRS